MEDPLPQISGLLAIGDGAATTLLRERQIDRVKPCPVAEDAGDEQAAWRPLDDRQCLHMPYRAVISTHVRVIQFVPPALRMYPYELMQADHSSNEVQRFFHSPVEVRKGLRNERLSVRTNPCSDTRCEMNCLRPLCGVTEDTSSGDKSR